MGKLAELIGNRIRRIRKEQGLKQEDMERFGLSYKYYQRIERGRANLTLETLEKIAAAFEMDPAELFSLPLAKSEEVDKLAGYVAEIIHVDDMEKARKLNLMIERIL